jgi:U3 small nucleolar RNA-associated protein 22
MAPPATKRRKLEHSDSEAESEGSFAGFDDTNGVELDGSDAEDASDNGSDVSMNGAEEVEDDEDINGEEEEEEEEGEDGFEVAEDVHPSRKQTTAGKATSESKPPKRPALSMQDGVYTAETFKSNMFKLQVDELLDQVKLKYGKREAPAENAMRTLKTIIEQIPDRDPLPVRI